MQAGDPGWRRKEDHGGDQPAAPAVHHLLQEVPTDRPGAAARRRDPPQAPQVPGKAVLWIQ